MKNNRLTNSEIHELKMVVDRLRELACMHNANFGFGDDEFDKYIKDTIRPYMSWFKCEAFKIEEILNSNI